MEQKIEINGAEASSANSSPLTEMVSNVTQAAATTAVPPPTLLEFPCHFPIKVLGKSQGDFMDEIISIVCQLDPRFDAQCIEQRSSSAGRYMGLTCSVYAQNRTHLDDIYRALTAHPKVAYVL